jgi:hypothetical protein
MKGRRGRLAKFLSIPVLAACGFVVAATAAGGGVADVLDGTPTPMPSPSPTVSSPEPTTPTPDPTPTPTTTTPPPTTTTTTTPPPVFEGCTPGFWKKPSRVWTDYTRNQTLGSVFVGLPPEIASRTLSAALQEGGGDLDALLRHAVAALLNAASPDVDYPLTTAQITAMVNAAIASGDATAIESLKDTLDEFNNLGGAC